jgi:hypothetical protein
MRVGRAQDTAERHAGQRNVVYVPPATAKEPRILEAGYGLTDAKFLHEKPLKHPLFAHMRLAMLKGAGIQVQATVMQDFLRPVRMLSDSADHHVGVMHHGLRMSFVCAQRYTLMHRPPTVPVQGDRSVRFAAGAVPNGRDDNAHASSRN